MNYIQALNSQIQSLGYDIYIYIYTDATQSLVMLCTLLLVPGLPMKSSVSTSMSSLVASMSSLVESLFTTSLGEEYN